MSTPTNPLLPHLEPIRRAAEVRAFKEAALWVADSTRTMQRDSVEFKWAEGARQYLWQLADERDGLGQWSSDMHRAKCFMTPVLVSRRGTGDMAVAVFLTHAWRHPGDKRPISFEADLWQSLPKPTK